jgi:hypothetical protein
MFENNSVEVLAHVMRERSEL